MNSGEFNYQGGDRKTFYTAFPFDGSKDNVWDRKGTEMSTNDSDAENVLQDFTNRFAHNVEYFLVGRHFGFVPYFFPGVVAIVLWLFSRERRRPWRLLIVPGGRRVGGRAADLGTVTPGAAAADRPGTGTSSASTRRSSS